MIKPKTFRFKLSIKMYKKTIYFYFGKCLLDDSIKLVLHYQGRNYQIVPERCIT